VTKGKRLSDIPSVIMPARIENAAKRPELVELNIDFPADDD